METNPNLNRFARNLNDLARSGKLDPVIGRMKRSDGYFRYFHAGQKTTLF